MTPSLWPPKQIKIGKNCFLLIRAIKKIHKGFIETTNEVPIPSKWEEQEIRLIHTSKFTWSLPSNTIYTQQILKTWITENKKWHISLIQKNIFRFEYPKLHSRSILFSEKEIRKVGNIDGITWISSEKGFRYVIMNNSQVKTLLSKKMITS